MRKVQKKNLIVAVTKNNKTVKKSMAKIKLLLALLLKNKFIKNLEIIG